MDPFEETDFDFAPMPTIERQALLSLEEAHELLHLLLAVAQEGGALSSQADHLARELAARIPSEDERASPSEPPH